MHPLKKTQGEHRWAHAGEAGSSRRVDGDKIKEESVVGTYQLFPEPRQTQRNMAPLLDIVSRGQPHTQMLLNQQVIHYFLIMISISVILRF
jgi:hypothetical protein